MGKRNTHGVEVGRAQWIGVFVELASFGHEFSSLVFFVRFFVTYFKTSFFLLQIAYVILSHCLISLKKI